MVIDKLTGVWVAVAALLTLAPLLYAAFFPNAVREGARGLRSWMSLLLPGLLCAPYAMVAVATGTFRWGWLAIYALLPVAVAALLSGARAADPELRGNWRDFTVLGVLGLAVDLRWLEGAWPPHLSVFSKVLLLDAGIWGFLAIRQLDGVGFDLRLRRQDWQVGLRELALYTPVAIAAGLALGFLHLHGFVPAEARLLQLPAAAVFTFFFIAVPEELFFRGWLQNLLERRIGRGWALAVTAVLFGLAHWNKRAVHFNWRYVLLAALAGVFYGRAWRQQRRVGASAVTHAAVDTIWSFWLR